jgi:hypothetical protein
MELCNEMNPPTCWIDIVSVGLQLWKGKTLRSHLCRLVLASEIYNLWKNRNALSHEDLPKTEEQVVRQIK